MAGQSSQLIRPALNLAIAALKDYRRRHFAIGHNAFMNGQVFIFTERDHQSYERYSKAIETIEKLKKEL